MGNYFLDILYVVTIIYFIHLLIFKVYYRNDIESDPDPDSQCAIDLGHTYRIALLPFTCIWSSKYRLKMCSLG